MPNFRTVRLITPASASRVGNTRAPTFVAQSVNFLGMQV